MSEKYDGVRAIYLGNNILVTTRGDRINVPENFFQDFPEDLPLDGELWIDYQRFSTISGLVRDRTTGPLGDYRWDQVKYMVFDLPVNSSSTLELKSGCVHYDYSKLDFLQRQMILDDYFANHVSSDAHLKLVSQHHVTSQMELEKIYQTVIGHHGEGVIINTDDGLYTHGRRTGYKLKPSDDSEAVVIGYREGAGRNTGLVGSFAVLFVTSDGVVQPRRRFFIGTGLTDLQRHKGRDLYPIGTVVTCIYNGLTSDNLPRFPRLKGIRSDFNVELDPKLISQSTWIK